MNDSQSNDLSQQRLSLPSVRVIIVLTLVLVVAAVYVTIWLPSQYQISTINLIEGIGGRVSIERVGPDWLRTFLGSDSMKGFDRVVGVVLTDTQADDALFERITRFRSLEFIWAGNTRITDVGLQYLADLTTLYQLELDGTLITSDGTKNLSGLTNLEVLGLFDVSLSDECLQSFSQMRKLSYLILSGSEITDEGVQFLVRNFDLESLGIDSDQITNSALKDIAKLRNLGQLTLVHSRISDSGLKYLYDMPRLDYLFLINTQVTDEGVKELQNALPDCTVEWENN